MKNRSRADACIGRTANNLLKYRGMRSRLDRITDWEELARQAGYKASALAQHLTTTPRQLQRYFLIKFRVSPKNWLHQIQMQEARRLLAQNRLVKEVSSDVCFGHASHFARAFKREHGTCPGTFHASTRLAQP